jgi:hypothetical protein
LVAIDALPRLGNRELKTWIETVCSKDLLSLDLERERKREGEKEKSRERTTNDKREPSRMRENHHESP